MKPLNAKSIYICYAEDDKETATRLKQVLEDLMGAEIWMRDFNLDGGSLVADTISVAVSEAKWFVILVTGSSVTSKWLNIEADLATFKALEDQDFRIVFLRIDNSDLPVHLKTATKVLHVITLSRTDSLESLFVTLADQIHKLGPLNIKEEIYVDRGNNADEFSISARRHRILFLLGWAGIGKSSFAIHSIAERLRKRPLVINLTRGHSADLLARQVIRKAHVSQPISMASTDAELTRLAIEAIEKRADNFFLCIDNAEEGLDVSNKIHPYLEAFMEAFIQKNVNTHIILPTTRFPEYGPTISRVADLLRLNGLEDRFIKESIDLWLEGTENHARYMAMAEIDDLIKLAGGYPLAAKMIASFLKARTPEQLLQPSQVKRFQLKLAEYILKSADQSYLTSLHLLILQILAAVREPMLLEDLLSVHELKQYPLEDVHKARCELLDWFLIEQNLEMISLHNFLQAYFRDDLDRNEKRLNAITVDFGCYAYDRAMELNGELTALPSHVQTEEQETEYIRLSNEILRYAVPAGKLLLAAGKEDLAKNLPIQIKGNLREMVFIYYQEKQDYTKALEYADKWLRIHPNDLEILLFQARCYRNQHTKESFHKAEKIINRIEKSDFSKRFAARIFREKALIAQYGGDWLNAKKLFRQGIEVYTSYPYPENRRGLAQILLMEAEDFPPWASERKTLADEALGLLEIARDGSASFDRFHLEIYIEALILAGHEDRALPLIEEKLDERPKDLRLNYRMAEILRQKEDYEGAISFARKAIDYGAAQARLTLANALYNLALSSTDNITPSKRQSMLEEALNVILKFKADSAYVEEITDSIASKIYRAIGNTTEARNRVMKYKNTKDPYTIYEQCRLDKDECMMYESERNYQKAIDCLDSAVGRIRIFALKRDLNTTLQGLLEEFVQEKERIQKMLAEAS